MPARRIEVTMNSWIENDDYLRKDALTLSYQIAVERRCIRHLDAKGYGHDMSLIGNLRFSIRLSLPHHPRRARKFC
jgi:hypothetical protein